MSLAVPRDHFAEELRILVRRFRQVREMPPK